MSTRSFIGFYDNKQTATEGIYHHFDGYPEGVGNTLYHLAQVYTDLDFLKELLYAHPSGLSTINSWSGAPEDLIGYDAYEKHRELVGGVFSDHYHKLDEAGFGVYYDGIRANDDDELMKWSQLPDSWCEFAYLIMPEQRTMLIFEVRYEQPPFLIEIVDFDQPVVAALLPDTAPENTVVQNLFDDLAQKVLATLNQKLE